MTSSLGDALDAAVPDLAPATRVRLERYVDLLERRNAALNLTAARTAQELAEHVRDSLTLLPYLDDPLVDVGSGGGFPALPLAIVAGCHVTLVESVLKKARFLAETLEALALPGTVVFDRAENAARRPDLRERFRSATARAVGPLPTVLELTIPFLQVGGRALLQRGRFDAKERGAAADAALILGAEIVAEIREAGETRIDEPFDAGRRLVIVQKNSPIGQRFPRRTGIPSKRPLCFESSA